MEQAALPFDDIPVIIVIVGGQILDRAGHEIRDHGIQRHTFAGDQNTGLARRAEAAFQPLLFHRRVQRQRGIHLADRTIGADRQHALAAAFDAIRNRVLHRRDTHIMQAAPVFLGGGHELWLVAQQVMQAGCQIETGLQRVDQHGAPCGADGAPAVGDANHQGLRACLFRLRKRHIGQTQIRLAPVQPQLTDGIFRTPVLDALRHFNRKVIRRIAQKKKIRCFDHDHMLLQFGFGSVSQPFGAIRLQMNGRRKRWRGNFAGIRRSKQELCTEIQPPMLQVRDHPCRAQRNLIPPKAGNS